MGTVYAVNFVASVTRFVVAKNFQLVGNFGLRVSVTVMETVFEISDVTCVSTY